MKKIIYSLVIMIAAGSLFTSCIQPIEPEGIYDLREAKARYYDALSKLRAADAMLVEAQAAHETQRAEFQKKMVENQELLNQAQKLANEAQALGNEQQKFYWEQEKERLETERELLRYQWEQDFLQAQLDLREAMAEFNMAMLDLTDAEKIALAEAVARYEDALEDYLAAQEDVALAEADLWDAMYAYENMNDVEGYYYNTYGDYINTGMDLVEYYESLIEIEESWAAYYAALYEFYENNTDLAAWAEELEALKAKRDELLYDRNQVTVDSVYFMEGVFHEANIAMGIAVDEWKEKNPAVAEPTAPKEPKESDYPASKYQKDSIAFPVLEYKTPSKAYDKFVSLLVGPDPAVAENYAKVNTIVGDSSNVIIVRDNTEKTLTLVANSQMKDFVLGSETPSTDSLKWTYYDKKAKKNVDVKAKWGLQGALSVLKRDLVLDDDPGKTPEEKEAEAEAAYKQWNSDRDTLLGLYAAKKAKTSVAEAYEPLKKAMDDLAQAKKDAASESASLVKAAEKLITAVNGMITHSDMSVADSTNLIAAFVEFATAREAYLDYKPYQNGVKYDNKNLFYYPKATAPDIVVDSIAFKDITFAMVNKDDEINQKKGFDYNYKTGTKLATNNRLYAFVEIAKQLLGEDFAAAIDGTWPKAKIADATILNKGTDDGAFYGAYKYNAGDPATITLEPTGDYTPKAVTDAVTKVQNAVAALNAVWDRFWKENLGATADADGKVTIPTLDEKYNPATYTLDAFMKPYNVVIFDGANIVWTEAIGDILASVDPNATTDNTGKNFDASGYVAGAAIFAGANGNTDFYTYLYKLNASKQPSTTDLKEIEEWIGKVVAAFDKDVADAEAAAKKAYDDAKAEYDKAEPTYKAAKEKYDAYYAALKAFVGTKTVDGKEVLLNVAKSDGKLIPVLKNLPYPTDYRTPYVKQTQKEPFVWVGEWDKTMIGGEQLELANKLFVDDEGTTYPELLATWRSEAKWINDQIAHYTAMINVIEKAYMAAIGTIYDVTGDVIEIVFDSEEGYLKDILDEINDYYEECLAYISMYTEFVEKAKAGYTYAQLNIMELEHLLAMAQQALKDAEIELALAEEYYNKVLNAILGAN